MATKQEKYNIASIECRKDHNGKLWNIRNFINDELHGEDRYYNEDGTYDKSR